MNPSWWKPLRAKVPRLTRRLRQPDERQQLGERSEQLALRFLTSQGYRMKERNVRFPVGEIDLIAWEGEALCFIEVRSTSSLQWGGPLASVTDRKRRRLIRAARWYVERLRELPLEMRFDVVAISWEGERAPTLELVRGAFDAG